jgi:hypothetical protein
VYNEKMLSALILRGGLLMLAGEGRTSRVNGRLSHL